MLPLVACACVAAVALNSGMLGHDCVSVIAAVDTQMRCACLLQVRSVRLSERSSCNVSA